MIAPDRDSEITFYEELGVIPGASPEELHDAFHLMVRLLHPDQQTDPHLKDIAETQMRKLNRIYAILSDPQRRRHYDELLDKKSSPSVILTSSPPDWNPWIARLAWALAIIASAGLVVWLASDNTRSKPSGALEPKGALASAAVPAPPSPAKAVVNDTSRATEVSRLRSDLKAATAQRDIAIHDLNRLHGTSQVAKSSSPQPGATITGLPSASGLQAPAGFSLPPIEWPAVKHLPGIWIYSKPPRDQKKRNQSRNAPDSIEVTVSEADGVIQGSYRAVSPDLNFTFTGNANGSHADCVWTGPGAAKGELALTLVSGNSLRIDWTTSEVSSQTVLSSGTTVLTRRIE